MKLTEFGKVVRKARLDANVTMSDMATSLQVSSAFLSSLETGRKKVPEDWAKKISAYFKKRGVAVEELQAAADVSNKSVSLEGLSTTHQMLIAGFARASFDEAQIKNLKALLAASNSKKRGS
ncbi:MAG: helix-turn-helix transcriptional regulator [Sideroxyarcus sp.]